MWGNMRVKVKRWQIWFDSWDIEARWSLVKPLTFPSSDHKLSEILVCQCSMETYQEDEGEHIVNVRPVVIVRGTVEDRCFAGGGGGARELDVLSTVLEGVICLMFAVLRGLAAASIGTVHLSVAVTGLRESVLIGVVLVTSGCEESAIAVLRDTVATVGEASHRLGVRRHDGKAGGAGGAAGGSGEGCSCSGRDIGGAEVGGGCGGGLCGGGDRGRGLTIKSKGKSGILYDCGREIGLTARLSGCRSSTQLTGWRKRNSKISRYSCT